MGYVTEYEVECKSCGRGFRKNELQYDSPAGRICKYCYERESQPLSTQPTINSNEERLKELEGSWHAVRHGEEFEWSKAMFRFELLRKLVLTNKRLIFLKDDEVDSEIPLNDIKNVTLNHNEAGNPYAKIELTSGTKTSIFFGCIGPKMFLGFFYVLPKQRKLTQEWIDAINNQLRKMGFLSYCGKCGNPLAPAEKFCPKCGSKMD